MFDLRGVCLVSLMRRLVAASSPMADAVVALCALISAMSDHRVVFCFWIGTERALSSAGRRYVSPTSVRLIAAAAGVLHLWTVPCLCGGDCASSAKGVL